MGGRVEFFLEDDSARIGLAFDQSRLEPGQLFVTGVSVALLGRENEKGAFEVADYCFVGLDDVPAVVPPPREPSLVAFVSGAAFSPTQALKFDLLSDFLSGNLPCFQEIACRVSRVVFAGNTVAMPVRIDEAVTRKKYGVEHAKYDFSNIRLLDGKLAALSASLPVDVMPGDAEPTNQTLPQTPIHRGLFPQASNHSAFQSVMNPYAFECNGVRFLGTSGQNLDDAWRFSEFKDRLDLAEAMLHWRNIAPTAPDTLWCFPFFDRDPFVLDQPQHLPDVLFVGNQPEFQTRIVTSPAGRKILIVLLPKFTESPSVVLVNTAELTCECVNFGTRGI